MKQFHLNHSDKVVSLTAVQMQPERKGIAHNIYSVISIVAYTQRLPQHTLFNEVKSFITKIHRAFSLLCSTAIAIDLLKDINLKTKVIFMYYNILLLISLFYEIKLYPACVRIDSDVIDQIICMIV